MATSRQVSNGSNPTSDWEQGYGFQFWRCRNGVYRGDGAFGQFCIVMPKHDAVIAITSGIRDLQGVLNLVWEHLLPAMKADASLPADAAMSDRLAKKLASLSLPPQAGRETSPNAKRVSGRIYDLPKSEGDVVDGVGVEFGTETTLLVEGGGKVRRVPCGRGEWKRGGTLPTAASRLASPSELPVAATGAWTDEDTFTVKACFYETPFCTTMQMRFAGDALVLDREANVGFGPTKRPTVVGLPRKAAAATPTVR
jgi:hypothetical protein